MIKTTTIYFKTILFLSVFILNIKFVNSQIIKEHCAFDKIYSEKLKDLKFRELYNEHNEMMNNYINLNYSMNKATITIPIVVHVLHFGEAIGVGSNIFQMLKL